MSVPGGAAIVALRAFGAVDVVERLHAFGPNLEGIPTPENRWTGSNRGGYASPSWDEVSQRLRVTLEESERIALERELVRIFSADLPVLPIYYDVDLLPVTSGLTGVQAARGMVHLGILHHTWNAHEWDLLP